MIGAKCEKCMRRHSPDEPCSAANDNQPFDEKEWRREYMKIYMRKKRERLKAAKLAEREAS